MPTPPAGENAALFRALVDSSSDVFALLDPSGTVLFVSDSIERVLGFAAKDRIGKNAFALVHEDDLPHVAEAFACAATFPRAPQAFSCRVRHKDGAWVHIDVTIVSRINDPVGGIVMNYRDVSKQASAEGRLRSSEARYRSLVQGAAYGIYRTTIDGEFLEANPALARMLGYGSVEELRAVNMRDIFARPEDRDALVRTPPGADAVASDVEWRRKDGAPISVRLTAQVVDLDGSGVNCLEGLAEDITKKRAAEEHLRQSQKMEAVGRLARGIAHDFNNVLAAIVGNADLLHLRVKKGDPMAADLTEISDAAERGAALTRQLLTFSRAREATEPQVLVFHDVVRGFDNMLQRLSGDIELRLHTPGKSPKVKIEPGQIEQMMMNLVLNAREAIDEGGSIDVRADTVTVNAANASRYRGLAPGRYARLAVRDDGRGIGPDMEPLLFEPFFSTKDPSKGPGLGLSIVYGIAKEAGGAVSFTSAPKEGTTFEVLLPAV